jgi:hypothetical protein
MSIADIDKIHALTPGEPCEFRYPARRDWRAGRVDHNGGGSFWRVQDGATGKVVRGLYIEHVRVPGTDPWEDGDAAPTPIPAPPSPVKAGLGQIDRAAAIALALEVTDMEISAGESGMIVASYRIGEGKRLSLTLAQGGGVPLDVEVSES